MARYGVVWFAVVFLCVCGMRRVFVRCGKTLVLKARGSFVHPTSPHLGCYYRSINNSHGIPQTHQPSPVHRNDEAAVDGTRKVITFRACAASVRSASMTSGKCMRLMSECLSWEIESASIMLLPTTRNPHMYIGASPKR